jgi:hypothetical protein
MIVKKSSGFGFRLGFSVVGTWTSEYTQFSQKSLCKRRRRLGRRPCWPSPIQVFAFCHQSSLLETCGKRRPDKKSSARRFGNSRTRQADRTRMCENQGFFSARLFRVSVSRARFSFKIFTPGSPPRPSRGLYVALATSPRTSSSVNPRSLATRGICSCAF